MASIANFIRTLIFVFVNDHSDCDNVTLSRPMSRYIIDRLY